MQISQNSTELSLVQYNLKYKAVIQDMVCESAQDREYSSILDIGCRWGRDIENIIALNVGVNIVGIDISFDAEYAHERLSNTNKATLLQAQGEALPFRNGAFDIVISSEVVEHIDDTNKFIKEVNRILKKHGTFIVSTPSRFNYVTLAGKIIPNRFKKLLRKYVYYLHPGKEENPHLYLRNFPFYSFYGKFLIKFSIIFPGVFI
jgi:ubiquinone/menaquinone biosynthesis C-methylase UbiE